MRRVVFFLSTLLISIYIHGQPRTIHLQDKEPAFKSFRVDDHTKSFSFNYTDVHFIEVETPQGSYNQLAIPGTYRSGNLGEPQLVSFQKLIVIPKGAQVKLTVTSFQEKVYNLDNFTSKSKLIPYQPSSIKNEPMVDQQWVKSEQAYKRNSFSKAPIAEIEVLGILREMQVAKITINPVAYNPVSHKLKCYNNIQLELEFTGKETWNFSPSSSMFSPYFTTIYEALNANEAYIDHPDLVNNPIRYLIISPPQFINSLQGFISWKTQKGFEVVVGNTNTIGSSPAQIKSWIQTQYADTLDGKTAPSFLLLVGDIAQIPASQMGIRTAKVTDLYYASVDGDMFPDLYYGRLPAQDTAQLLAMIAKNLLYEKYQFPDDSFLDQVTLIAGADATWNPRVAQPTVRYGTENYFNTLKGYSTVNSFLSSYTDCYSKEKVSVGFINYTAHCSQTSWGNPLLNVAAASGFTNQGKYPLAVGNCCTSGDFSIGTCIGEAWVRNPAGGAIAYLGSVPDTYWWEDFYWAVGAHDPVYNNYPSVEGSSLGMFDAPFISDYVTTGALLFSGNLAVTEAHNQGYVSDVDSRYYWEAYHCLGDPSLVPYFRKGIIQQVKHPQRLESGIGEFIVEALEGSTITLTSRNNILATTQVVSNEKTSLFFDKLFEGDSVHLVVTKPNYQPYIADIPVTVSEKAFLALKSCLVNDINGNINGQADFNENLFLDLMVENIGAATAKFIEVTIHTESPYILEQKNGTFHFDSLNIGTAFGIQSTFEFKIADSVPDQSEIWIQVQLSDSIAGQPRKYYIYQRSMLINAPKLNINPIILIDDFYGNGNEMADAGESLKLKVSFTNEGHSMVSSTITMKSLFGDSISVITPESYFFDGLEPGETKMSIFDIKIQNNASTRDSMLITLSNGTYNDNLNFILPVGFNTLNQIGFEVQPLAEYPFNNYYKNNRTQILFKKEEIYQGTQLLKAVRFHFSEITSEATYRDLPNFTFKLIATSMDQMSTFVEMDEAHLLFDTSLYMLPNQTGWYQIDFLNPYWMLAPKNLILEINWGTSNNYSPIEQRTKIFGHLTSYNSVVFGADDDTYPAPFEGVSKWRPNVQWVYDTLAVTCLDLSVDIPLEETASFSNGQIRIENDILFPDSLGRVKHYSTKWPTELPVIAKFYGYRDTVFNFIKSSPYSFIPLELKRNPQCNFILENQWGMPISGAHITFNGCNLVTDSNGRGESFAAQAGEFSTYQIVKEGYHIVFDSVYPFGSEMEIKITMTNDFADARFELVNSRKYPVSGAIIFVDGQPFYSDSLGQALAPDLVEGVHSLLIHRAGFQSFTGNVVISKWDSIFKFQLLTLGSVNFSITNGWQSLEKVKIFFNGDSLVTNSLGKVTKTQVLEGNYQWSTSATGYYPATGTLDMFGSDTSIQVTLNPIPDVTIFVYNGKVPLTGISVRINQQEYITDSLGLIKLVDFGIGSFDYEILKSGYYPVFDQFTSSVSDTLLLVRMHEIPDAKFLVSNKGKGIEGASIIINSDTLICGNSGEATFSDLEIGSYNIVISKQGFYDLLSDIHIGLNDTVFYFELIKIPTISWQIVSDGLFVDSASIKFNGSTYITDLFGQVQIQVPIQSCYTYDVSKSGYFQFTDSLCVSENDTLVIVFLNKMMDLLFTITDGRLPISQAQITIANDKKMTDTNGEVLFQGLYPGIQHYLISKEGYHSVKDSIELSAPITQEFIRLENENYQVTFRITDELGMPLPDARILCAGIESVTDSTGMAVLAPFLVNQTYAYSINKNGYLEHTGNFTIEQSNLNIEIQLVPETFDVTFKIIDEHGDVQGASITFDNKVKSTSFDGSTVFYNIRPDGNMPYIVSKPNTHITDTGVVVLQSDTLILVPLLLISTNEMELADFEVYPNPTRKVLYILSKTNESGSFQIINNQGNIISQGIMINNQTKVDLQNIKPGIYTLKIFYPAYTRQTLFMTY